MTSSCIHTALAGVFALATAMSAAAVAAEKPIVTFAVEGDYADVRADLEDAIVNRGLVVAYVAKIADMLKRTAGVVEGAKPVYTFGESLQFCSATLSRRTMEANPDNIAFCPYQVFVYQKAGDKTTVTVGYRRVPECCDDASRAAIADINKLLDGIVRETAGVE